MSSHVGITDHAELGADKFKWTIKNFKKQMATFPVIKSPSFAITSTNPTIKARPFHLEMEIPNRKLLPNKKPGNFRCPVYLLQEEEGQIETKIILDDFSPKPKGTFFGYVYGSAPFVHVSLEAKRVVQTSLVPPDKKKVMTVILPSNESIFPNDITIEFQMSQTQSVAKVVS
jgi:hypothetical protein